MHINGFDLLLWAASFAGNVCLLLVLFVRSRVRVSPIFTTFIVAAVLRTMALFYIQRHGSRALYFYTYWSLAIAIDVVLQLGLVIEILIGVFRLSGEVPEDAKKHLLSLAIGSVGAAGTLTYLAAPEAQMAIQRWMIRGNFFSSALMSELFVGVMWLALKHGLPMKRQVSRICEGLGVYSLCDVLIEAAHTYFGLRHGDVIYLQLSRLRIAVYLMCLAYWVATLWINAPVAQEATDEVLADLSHLGQLADANLMAAKGRRSRLR